MEGNRISRWRVQKSLKRYKSKLVTSKAYTICVASSTTEGRANSMLACPE